VCRCACGSKCCTLVLDHLHSPLPNGPEVLQIVTITIIIIASLHHFIITISVIAIITIILLILITYHSVSHHRGGPQVLEKKGIVMGAELRRAVEVMDARGTMNSGAKLVARAWVDPEFKTRLLADAAAAAKELGIETSNWTAPAKPGERQSLYV
jgi:hypothetical protein